MQAFKSPFNSSVYGMSGSNSPGSPTVAPPAFGAPSHVAFPGYPAESENDTQHFNKVFSHLHQTIVAHGDVVGLLGLDNLIKKTMKLSGSHDRIFFLHERHFQFFAIFTRVLGVIERAKQHSIAQEPTFSQKLQSLEKTMKELGAYVVRYRQQSNLLGDGFSFRPQS